MAKKARRPDEPYNVIDADGIFIDAFSKVSKAKRCVATATDPMRIYKLVTLEEVAVIRAAKSAAIVWAGPWRRTSTTVTEAMEKLVKAVEASRG